MEGILRKAGKRYVIECDDYAPQRFSCRRGRTWYVKVTTHWRNHILPICINQANFYRFVANLSYTCPNLGDQVEMWVSGWDLSRVDCVKTDTQSIYFGSELCIITNEGEVDVHDLPSSFSKQTLVGASPPEVRVNSTIVFLGASWRNSTFASTSAMCCPLRGKLPSHHSG